jgi:hypothetical protein
MCVCVCVYGKAYSFPIYEWNVSSHWLHEWNKTENHAGRHKDELSLVYARFEILTTMLLRLESWKVNLRQLVNS